MIEVLTPDEVALMNARADVLNLAIDLEEIAHALLLIAGGRAEAPDVRQIRGHIDAAGDLIVRVSLPWDVVLEHARALPRDRVGTS